MKTKKMFNALIIVAMFLALVAPGVLAAPVGFQSTDDEPQLIKKEDNRPDPFTTEQLQLKKQALRRN